MSDAYLIDTRCGVIGKTNRWTGYKTVFAAWRLTAGRDGGAFGIPKSTRNTFSYLDLSVFEIHLRKHTHFQFPYL